jgi:predicted DNA-binding transcriptional regulator YafY
MSTDLPARLLRLLSLLQGRREWGGSELAERLQVTGRTVRRDIVRLRRLGYPIHGTKGTWGGYRLQSGRDLPPLLLDDEEAMAIAVALQGAGTTGVASVDEASVRALAKLEQVLPARLRQRVGTVTAATSSVSLPGAQVDPAMLGIVAGACRDREVLALRYERRDGTAVRRRVDRYRATATVRQPHDAVRERLPMAIRERLILVDEHTTRVRLDTDSLAELVGNLVALDSDLVLEASPKTRQDLARAASQLLAASG